VTFLVDRLEEKGLVWRTVDEHDRRVKAVSLTAAGAAVRQRMVAAAASAPALPCSRRPRRRSSPGYCRYAWRVPRHQRPGEADRIIFV